MAMKQALMLSTTTVLLLAVTSSVEGQVERNLKAGKLKYHTYCVSCHGISGKGDGPATTSLNPKPRDITNGDHMNTLSDKYIFDIIKGGGASVKKSPLMPAWSGALNDKEICNLVTYVRSLGRQKPPK